MHAIPGHELSCLHTSAVFSLLFQKAAFQAGQAEARQGNSHPQGIPHADSRMDDDEALAEEGEDMRPGRPKVQAEVQDGVFERRTVGCTGTR